MAYRPFYDLAPTCPPATVATTATVGGQAGGSVANVATVAGVTSRADDEAEAEYAFEERAGILEFDCGLTRAEAERLARLQTNHTRH